LRTGCRGRPEKDEVKEGEDCITRNFVIYSLLRIITMIK
jgi:hypothetical protein